MEVRSIIREACSRVNIVPRRQAIAGDIQETAFKLLKGIVSKYNCDSLLNFTQNSFIVNNSRYIHIYDETDYMAGKYNYYGDVFDDLPDVTEDMYVNNAMALVKETSNAAFSAGKRDYGSYVQYYWQGHQLREPYSSRVQQMKLYMSMEHFQVHDVAKINSIYLVSLAGQPYMENYELKFVPAYKFDSYTNDSNIYTVTEKSEGEWFIELKPIVAAMNYRLKINYNEAIEFDIDSDLFIPDNYVELLIVALAHKLAIQYPRLDDAQMQRLETEVKVLVDNVRTPKAITRSIIREDYFDNWAGRMTQAQLLGGGWI